MKKIALVGTSPIMLIIANHLSKLGNKITIFDISKKIGGAWSYFKFKKDFICPCVLWDLKHITINQPTN